MIRFQDWKISCEGNLLAMQYDNLSRQLQVSGSLPEGWDWAVLVQSGQLFDIIPLESQADGSLTAVLTAQQLCRSGCYTLQLRGVKGETVRHTNQITVFVGRSLSGDENWPEIPSEFTQLEQRVHEAMRAAAASERAAAASEGTAAAAASEVAVAVAAAKEYAERMEEVRDALIHVEPAGGATAVELLAQSGILTPAWDGGAFCTDGDGTIYIL